MIPSPITKFKCGAEAQPSKVIVSTEEPVPAEPREGEAEDFRLWGTDWCPGPGSCCPRGRITLNQSHKSQKEGLPKLLVAWPPRAASLAEQALLRRTACLHILCGCKLIARWVLGFNFLLWKFQTSTKSTRQRLNPQ